MESLEEEARRVATLYRFLSRVFIREIDIQLLRELRRPYLYEILRSVGIGFGPEFLVEDEEKLIEDLSCEYTYLFITPGRISLYESVYKEGQLVGITTSKVKDFYSRAGLSLFLDNIPPDHIAVELGFMGCLKEKEAEFQEEGKEEELKSLFNLQREFFKEHLNEWSQEFFERVGRETRLSFYQKVADLGKELIEFELKKNGYSCYLHSRKDQFWEDNYNRKDCFRA